MQRAAVADECTVSDRTSMVYRMQHADCNATYNRSAQSAVG